METIFPVKFKGKLSIDQIERFVDVCMEFAADIQIDVSFVRGRNTPTSDEHKTIEIHQRLNEATRQQITLTPQ